MVVHPLSIISSFQHKDMISLDHCNTLQLQIRDCLRNDTGWFMDTKILEMIGLKRRKTDQLFHFLGVYPLWLEKA